MRILLLNNEHLLIYINLSERELRAMGNTEKEQSEAMKRYIREAFIPEYAKNFNKELSALNIKFYGKIHFDRTRLNNKLNVHCHLVVSRKYQINKNTHNHILINNIPRMKQ